MVHYLGTCESCKSGRYEVIIQPNYEGYSQTQPFSYVRISFSPQPHHMMEPLPDIIVYPLTSPTHFRKMLPLKTEPWQDLHIFITIALLSSF